MRDIEDARFTYTLRFHITYRFFKFTDIDWIHEIIRNTRRKVLDEAEREAYLPTKERRRLRFLVTSASTEKSFEIEAAIVAITGAMEIVSYGYLIKKMYDSLKEQSERDIFLARRGMYRANLEEVWVGYVKRRTERLFDEKGVMRKEINEEEFEMKRSRKKRSDYFP